jgi:hypothetical protein
MPTTAKRRHKSTKWLLVRVIAWCWFTVSHSGVQGFSAAAKHRSPGLLPKQATEQQQPPISNTTPLKTYDAWINQKLARADQVSLAELDDTWELPRYTLRDLQHMLHSSSARDEMVVALQQSGSCLVVELDGSQTKNSSGTDNVTDDHDHHWLTDMWNFMTYMFETSSDKREEFRHQRMGAIDNMDSGYAFIQTLYNSSSKNDNNHASATVSGLPARVQGPAATAAATASFVNLHNLAKIVAMAALASAQNMTVATAEIMLDSLLDAETSRSSTQQQSSKKLTGTYQRMVQYYVPLPVVEPSHMLDFASTSKKEMVQESLCSHCDWTITTAIPVSKTPGLQIWNPRYRTWIQPEDNVEKNKNCVMVLIGKWLELSTSGTVESCIHRVVTTSRGAGRYSAPFFLRPTDALFASVAEQFDNTNNATTTAAVSTTREHSMHAIHTFLHSRRGGAQSVSTNLR